MKATEQYFHVVLFIILYNVVLVAFMSVAEPLACDQSQWVLVSCGTDYYMNSEM